MSSLCFTYVAAALRLMATKSVVQLTVAAAFDVKLSLVLKIFRALCNVSFQLHPLHLWQLLWWRDIV
jgi:hypothetical protein